jgi:phage shock protein E
MPAPGQRKAHYKRRSEVSLKTIQELIADTTKHVTTMDAAAAKRERAENGGYLIDVREPGEVAVKQARGTHNIPRGVLEMKITELCPVAGDPIYLHCASGGRARLSAAQLLLMGYQHVVAINNDVDEVCRIFSDE